MRIQLMSDLHLEHDPGFVPRPADGAELLVLAGDIGSYQPGSALQEPDFGLGRFAPGRTWPTPVLYVPGNHEYDGLDFDTAHQALREACERLGIIWLERATRVHQGLRFIGTTLWADFDGVAAQDPRCIKSPTRALIERERAFRAANYWLTKACTTRHGQPFLAEQMREQALICHDWLSQALAQPFDGRTVVVTHFAPSLRSADPRYGLRPGTAGFCNALDELLDQADWWLHGHLHCPIDYQAGRCRVMANPLGYAEKNEQGHFAPRSLLDV